MVKRNNVRLSSSHRLMDARVKPGHDVESHRGKLQHHYFSVHIFSSMHEPCAIIPARRILAGFRPKLSVSNPSPLLQRVAERRNSQPRNAAAVGLPCGETDPVCETGLPAHNADRRASRRPAAAFFLRPRDRLLKRTGAPFTESP